MNNNLFFKPTPLYKEFVVLDQIEKNYLVTQRELSFVLNVSVSMINEYLVDAEENGFLIRKYHSSKTVEYWITKRGIERKKHLNILFLRSAQGIYHKAQENIVEFLHMVEKKGFQSVFLYGAGEVAEVILSTIMYVKGFSLRVLGLIDDDIEKKGTTLLGVPIYENEVINKEMHDGIIISSHAHNMKIMNKLMDIAYDPSKIISFFD